nr:glycoside hydrolase family 24 [uncultured Mediterranean phage uvMED]
MLHKTMAKQMLKRHEGLRLTVYDCTAGKKTIGYGRNLEDRGITEKEAEQLLDNDIQAIEAQLRNSFTFYGSLSDPRKAVLIDLTFNIGLAGVKGFKKMCSALEKQDYTEAKTQLLDSRYARQVPNRAKELAQLLEGTEGTWNQT